MRTVLLAAALLIGFGGLTGCETNASKTPAAGTPPPEDSGTENINKGKPRIPGPAAPK